MTRLLSRTKPFFHMMLGIICGLSILFTGCKSDTPTNTTFPHITHTLPRDDGSLITYYLQQHHTNQYSDTLLILLQGSTCDSIAYMTENRQTFSLIWPGADILTVEKYGIDENLIPNTENNFEPQCPLAYLQNDSPEQRVQDLIVVLDNTLQNHPYKHIIVFGGSEGASVAISLNAKIDSLSAVIAAGGGGRYLIDDIIYSTVSQMTDQNQDEIEAAIQNLQDFKTYILEQPESKIDLGGSDHGYKWWHSEMQRDQFLAICASHAPVLYIQGGQDTSVNPAATQAMINRLRENENCAQYIRYTIYPELEHDFTDPHGVNRSQQVAHDIHLWLEDILN